MNLLSAVWEGRWFGKNETLVELSEFLQKTSLQRRYEIRGRTLTDTVLLGQAVGLGRTRR